MGRDDELRAKVAAYPPSGFVMELAEQGTTINWAGEGAGLVDEVLPAAEVVDRTVAEAEQLLRRATDVLAD